MSSVDDDDRMLGRLTELAAATHLLVACGFDGALADAAGDPADARAEQPSSEALNVLLALPRTSVAVLSRRPADEVAELMYLSGSKGGARLVGPAALPGLRDELGVDAVVVVDADPEALAGLGPADLGVVVGEGEEPLPGGASYRVDGPADVADVLEELVRLRRS